MTFICYQVFSRSLTRLMESSPVPLDSFGSLMLGDVASISSVYTLVAHFFEQSALRIKLHVLWIIVSSVYALFFQTLLSAMTGYNGRYFLTRRHRNSTDQPQPLHSLLYKQHSPNQRNHGPIFAWSITLYTMAPVSVSSMSTCCIIKQTQTLWAPCKKT